MKKKCDPNTVRKVELPSKNTQELSQDKYASQQVRKIKQRRNLLPKKININFSNLNQIPKSKEVKAPFLKMKILDIFLSWLLTLCTENDWERSKEQKKARFLSNSS